MFTQELIQNADDAGATRVVFIHDERNYGHESILTDEFGKYQGMYYFRKRYLVNYRYLSIIHSQTNYVI